MNCEYYAYYTQMKNWCFEIPKKLNKYYTVLNDSNKVGMIEIKIINHQKEVINCPIKEEKKEYDFIVDRYAMKAGVNFNPDRQSVLDVDKDKILMRVSYYNIEKDEFCYEKGVLYFNVEQINHRIKII
jgi:hypothetical protein